MLPAGPTPTTEPSASPSPSYLWNQVSDAVHSGPDAMSHLLLNTGDSVAHLVVKAVLVLAALLITRLLAHRLITAVTDRIATSAWSGRWDRLTIWPGQRTRPRLFPRTLRRSDTGPHPVNPVIEEVERQVTALSERRKQRAKAIASLLGHLSSAALAVVGVLVFVSGTGLSRAGVFTAGLFGLIAAVSVQGLARDIVAGLFVLLEDTYGIGDYVDTTLGAAGVVEEIGLRTTRLRGRDGTIWHVRHGEIARLGNRTQAQTHLTLDIRAGFPETGDPALPPTAVERLAAAERVVRMSLARLDRDLASAAGANPLEDGEVAGTLAEILPALVPGAPRQALAALAAATSDADLVDTQPLAFEPGALDALEDLGDLLEDAQVPVLTQTLLAGLINAGDDHVVLRVTARVADTSLEQALAVLRRRLYLDLNSAGFTASFTVPGAEDV